MILTESKVLDILCFGEPLFEFNEQEGGLFLPSQGGDTSNCAVAAARQGASAAVLARVGNDHFGKSFMDFWRREGVDTTGATAVDGEFTGIYIVTHGASGHEFTYYRAGSASCCWTPCDLPRDLIMQTKIFHFSGISLAISENSADTAFAAARIARDAGAKISFDPNYRSKLLSPERAKSLFRDAFQICDIALPGIDDVKFLLGHADPDAAIGYFRSLGCEIVALTLGDQGAIVATQSRCERIAPYRVASVDATGAGDTFDGAFLAEYSKGSDPFYCARHANAAAAISTQGYGATAAMPLRKGVIELLGEQAT